MPSPPNNQAVRSRAVSDLIAGIAFAISLLLFLGSLTQDGFYIDRADNPRAWASCIGLLLIGWIGVLNGIWAWLANPTLMIAWGLMFFRRLRIAAVIFGGMSLALALSFLCVTHVMTDEAGNQSGITGYGAGYWMWVASIGVTVLGSFFAIVTDQFRPVKNQNASSDPPTSTPERS